MVITINMEMDLPVVTSTIGPTYANKINKALQDVVDGHDHSDGKGPRVTPAGMYFNADVDLSVSGTSYNIIGLRSVRLANQTASLTDPSDVLQLYNLNNDLYWKNITGTDVKITNGGTLNASGLVTNTYPTHDTSTDLTIASSATYTYIRVNTTANRTLTLPTASAAGNGRYWIIKDISGASATHGIGVVPSGGDTIDGYAGSVSLSSNYGVWTITSNGVDGWNIQATGLLNVPIVDAMISDAANITGSKIAGATTTTVGVIKLATDLDGYYNTPTVQQLTGSSGVVTIVANTLRRKAAVSGSGNPLTISAGDAGTVASAGGSIFMITGSDLSTGANDGSFNVSMGADELAFQLKASASGSGLNTDLYFYPTKATPVIGQRARLTNGNGAQLSVKAQDALGNSGVGGTLLLAGGHSPGSIDQGVVLVRAGGSTGPVVMSAYSFNDIILTNRYVFAIHAPANEAGITQTNMPATTGSSVTWMATALTVPTGNPVGGAILYVDGTTKAFTTRSEDGFSFGTTGETKTSAGGGGATLPAAPVGFLKAYANGTEIRIPYYGA